MNRRRVSRRVGRGVGRRRKGRMERKEMNYLIDSS